VQRRILRPEREEVARDWRRLRNEELHSLNAPPDIIRVIKSMRMRWAGHVAQMGDVGNAYKILVENLSRRDDLEDAGLDGKIISEWILGIQGEGVWTGCIWLSADKWRALVNAVMKLRGP
jgi:hypothetical protein